MISVHKSDYRDVVMQMGQLTPMETISFLDVFLPENIAVGMGDQFAIREGDAVCPVSVHRVQLPAQEG